MNSYQQAFEAIERASHGSLARPWSSKYEARGPLVRSYAWAIPNDEAIDVISRYSPIVEVGAGTGYWASLIAATGASIRAFDSSPPRFGKNGFEHDKTWFHVERANANVSARFPHRTLFLCWPPYDTGMAMEALRAYRGEHVIYVGESWGGCTGNDEFHETLLREFEQIKHVEIPQWDGIRDSLRVHRRRDVPLALEEP